jgi:cell division protease FtsH
MANKSKAPRVRVLRININPMFALVSLFLVIFLVAGVINNAPSNRTAVSVSQFLNSLKANEYSRVSIQDNGEVLAQAKYVYEVDKSEDGPCKELLTDPSCLRMAVYKGTNENVGLVEIKMEDLLAKLKQPTVLQQLQNALSRSGEAPIVELIFSEDFIIARTADSKKGDFIVGKSNKRQLEVAAKDAGLNLNQLGLIQTNLQTAATRISYSSLSERAKHGDIMVIYEIGPRVYARLADNTIPTFSIRWDGGINGFSRTLQEEGIDLANQDVEIGSIIVSSVPWNDIISVLTIVGFMALGFFLLRGMQNSGSGLMRLGQSKARMFWGVKPDITFKDVAGVDEAKQELEEIVQFLRTPEKFRKLGARIPKGVLMVGQPGTGKTMLARAIAGEAGVPFFHTSGSEFEEMLVGTGASRVRDLFEKAKKAAPSLIFIDEVDAVARRRGTTLQSSTTEQTLNQILVEMDGFEQGTNVIVIAATNRPDVLDPAILRPGRFDRRVVLDLPDIEGRKQILVVHSKNKPLAPDVDLEKVAKRTTGFSGAELENTLNEAAIIAARDNRSQITNHDIEEAASKVTMGPVRKSLRRSDDELNLVAVHEAGHAVVAHYTPGSDPVHRVSILSRGMAGGVTHFLPADENRMMSRSRLLARLAVALGGRAAEEIILNDISTGASSDIESATAIAKSMVQRFGMSEKLGLVRYGDSEANYWAEVRDYSDDTAHMIDEEVRGILNEAYARAKEVINANRAKFDEVVAILLEKEVLEGEDFTSLLTGEGKKSQDKAE